MFQNKRFLTRGVQAELPMELQLFLWNCIDQLPEERDYFQVFALKEIDGKQHIHHFSEQPEYSQDYMIDIANPVNQKVYVIDDTDHGTGRSFALTAWRITPPPANAVGNASGMRMSMVITTSRCAAIAIITATPDAAVVMRYYMRTMPIIWTVKHTVVTATRTSVKKAI